MGLGLGKLYIYACRYIRRDMLIMLLKCGSDSDIAK